MPAYSHQSSARASDLSLHEAPTPSTRFHGARGLGLLRYASYTRVLATDRVAWLCQKAIDYQNSHVIDKRISSFACSSSKAPLSSNFKQFCSKCPLDFLRKALNLFTRHHRVLDTYNRKEQCFEAYWPFNGQLVDCTCGPTDHNLWRRLLQKEITRYRCPRSRRSATVDMQQ